ncbi:uncharacterized protein [Euphorbia lathyris]|uniref:uncharacterized protein n=1 Tax=Euphorbia lathyris TaxID=212925 RepID=UPI003313C6CC
MRRDAKSMFKVDVSEAKCLRARQLILEQLDSSYKQEYATLEAYTSECMTTNPGSCLKVDLKREDLRQGRRVFWRIFICFAALKKGWKEGCRPIIGLDGCFLKGICKGVLLVAYGRDADDHFYPIAWAVVDRESGRSWEWFIQHLIIQMELGKGENLTLISDMQKGFLPAIAKYLPDAEHRWCARHIHANWSKKWRSGELSKWFWSCSWSTYPEEFKDNLKTLGSISKEAAEHLVSYPPQRWCMVYFSGRSKDMIVTNNHVESFNAWIKVPREKSIYKLLDGIRLEVMGKLKDCAKEATKWKKEWSPKCMKVYNLNSEIAQMCRVEWNGDDGYEVSEGQDKHAVMLEKKLCTCREWELSGIPCPYAICALRHKRMDPLKEISMFYHISTFKKTYSSKLQPVRGKAFWNVDAFEPILPPPIVRMPGRPKKKRVREATEPDRQSQTQKLSRAGHKKKCSKCGVFGHNNLKCKGVPTDASTTSGPGQTSGSSSRHPSTDATHTNDATPHTGGPTNNGSRPTKIAVRRARSNAPTANAPAINAPITNALAANAPAANELPRHPSVLTSDQQYKDMTNRFYEAIRQRHNTWNGKARMNEGVAEVNEAEVHGAVDEVPGMAALVHKADPKVVFPIPSEHKLRHANCERTHWFKKDTIQGEDLLPTDLPFEGQGLMWNGKRRLQEIPYKQKGRRGSDCKRINIDFVGYVGYFGFHFLFT